MKKKNILFFLLCFLLTSLSAQTLEQARGMYGRGQYAEAKPVFQKYVKSQPANGNYNLWYGVCCLETGEPAEALKHLESAVKRRVPSGQLYLARAYNDLYRFEEAIETYETYISDLRKRKRSTEEAEQLLEKSKSNLRMLKGVEEVCFIDSFVVDKEKFLDAYKISPESGKLFMYDTYFNDSGKEGGTVYETELGNKLYYSEMQPDSTLSILSRNKLLDKWSDGSLLPGSINEAMNADYPYVLTDGITIYYASDGPGSMGGYDIFVTRYNTNTDSYLMPENVGMPFNSPYNDYMMVFDEVKGLGWFVSDRFQPEGKACVYLFIPNPEHKRVESEDIEVKRARAAITAIRDSWKESSDYADLIRLSHTEIPYGEKKIEKDFEFIIGNNIVYYKLDDINSPEAKGYYEKVVALNKQIKELNEKLDGLRVSYAEGNKARKEQLKPTILQAEEQLNALLEQPGELEKKARNAEINYLKNKR